MILERVSLPKPLAECTSRELAHFAGFEDHTLDEPFADAGRSELRRIGRVSLRTNIDVETFLAQRRNVGNLRGRAANGSRRSRTIRPARRRAAI